MQYSDALLQVMCKFKKLECLFRTLLKKLFKISDPGLFFLRWCLFYAFHSKQLILIKMSHGWILTWVLCSTYSAKTSAISSTIDIKLGTNAHPNVLPPATKDYFS